MSHNSKSDVSNPVKRLKLYAGIDKPQTYPDGDVTDLEMPFWRRITDPAWVDQYVHMLGKWRYE